MTKRLLTNSDYEAEFLPKICLTGTCRISVARMTVFPQISGHYIEKGILAPLVKGSDKWLGETLLI